MDSSIKKSIRGRDIFLHLDIFFLSMEFFGQKMIRGIFFFFRNSMDFSPKK